VKEEKMKNEKKFDARPKVSGFFRFLDDYYYDDLLHGQVVYSKIHHGNIKRILFPKNYDLSDFTIVQAKDIPGLNVVPEPESDQPFFPNEEVFHYGQIILAVAHEDKNMVKDFIKNIEIEYEELPAIIDIKETLENVKNSFGKEITIDHRTEEEISYDWIHHHSVYYTPHQEQAYLETQGMIAIFKESDKTMFIRGTMQCPFFVKEAVETIMGDAVKETIVETSEGIGGAFGGKEDFPSLLAGITALLSYKSKKPVKIVLDRSDDISITTKRHPSRIEIHSYTEPGTKKIKKLDIDYRLDSGFYQTLSPVVLSRGVLHASSGYAIDDVYIKGRLLQSNTPSNGAFRGFGAPQAFFAIESHIDKIAASLQMDAYDFRKLNISRLNDEFPSSQKIKEEHLLDCLERVIEWSDYKKKKDEFAAFNKNNNNKKGIGISIAYHGGGYTGNGEVVLDSKVKISVDKQANATIFVSNVDMGQGAHTTLAQLFAETINHPFEKTSVSLPNTKFCPNSGPTVASRTIYIVGGMIQKLAKKMQKELQFKTLEEYVQKNQKEFPKEFFITFEQEPDVIFDEKTYQGVGYKDYSWAACVMEIYYHANSYKIDLKKCWAVMDIGQPVNPKIAIGQAEGGILQGLGYGSTEFFYKKGFGRMHGFTDYTLPTTMDIPEMKIEFIHTDSPISKGLGEIPMNFPAPAIRNAFFNATGVFIDEIPLIPERIFNAMKNKDKS
jgi:CO/xanthine dehydrogenase Mo-binding subunit